MTTGRRPILALALLPVLSSCAVVVPFPLPDRSSLTSLSTIGGEIALSGLPGLAGADSATVSLHERGQPDAIVASARVPLAARDFPVGFTVDYDPARLVSGRFYELQATASDAEGAILATSDAVPFPIDGRAVRLVLARRAKTGR